jgi:serine/threonine protein kinase
MMDYLKVIDEEITIWKYLDHKNVCKLYQVIDDLTDDYIYLVM